MSTQITTELIKELRDATGISIMQCKNALEEAEGDMEKALLVLKKKSSDIAMKKSDREASDGVIVVKEGEGKTILLTLHCETDFVAKNSDFTDLAEALATVAISEGVDKMKEKASDMINPVLQKVGEKIEIGMVNEIIGDVIGSYIHNGKNAVIVSIKGGDKDLAKDIAMHIAAMRPSFTHRDEIDEDMRNKAKEVFQKEVDESDKPADIKEKMLNGKLDTYFKEQTLVDQSFVKNPDMTVGELLAKGGATIVEFVRESIG